MAFPNDNNISSDDYSSSSERTTNPNRKNTANQRDSSDSSNEADGNGPRLTSDPPRAPPAVNASSREPQQFQAQTNMQLRCSSVVDNNCFTIDNARQHHDNYRYSPQIERITKILQDVLDILDSELPEYSFDEE